jgi:hypothetical protein
MTDLSSRLADFESAQPEITSGHIGRFRGVARDSAGEPARVIRLKGCRADCARHARHGAARGCRSWSSPHRGDRGTPCRGRTSVWSRSRLAVTRGLVQVMAAPLCHLAAPAAGGGEDPMPQRIAGRIGNLAGNGFRQPGRSPSGGHVLLVHPPRWNDLFGADQLLLVLSPCSA